jgi:hypothetical protein
MLVQVVFGNGWPRTMISDHVEFSLQAPNTTATAMQQGCRPLDHDFMERERHTR